MKAYYEYEDGSFFDMLLNSNRCAFLKSHVVPYAKLAYQTAYLKAHFINNKE